MKKTGLLLCVLLIKTLYSQKTAYIPLYLQDASDVNGSQFTWSKTAQSPNFTIIWGDSVGTSPATYTDNTLAFDPVKLLDTLETIYQAFKGFGFVRDSVGTNLSLYKIPVIMYNTWGFSGSTGYANGGDADGVIGAFWVHPIAMHNGHVAAHELTHSLQFQTQIDYRNTHGFGPLWNNAGIFFETHANFMRNLLYPMDVTAWGMDVYHIETLGDWKNTYENYEFLMAIKETHGVDMVNRLWRESTSNEYPLQTYKRLAGFNQTQFNTNMYEYARRMPVFDFPGNNLGSYFRQYRHDDLLQFLPSVQATYSILRQDTITPTRYQIPIELAPEEYAYNIIPLYPDADSCAVIIKFKGHTEVNSHAGWRYGFVSTYTDGTISRYGTTYSDDTKELSFSLLPGEASMYLVIMGAPTDDITTNASNDTWHGYPKHFRYPYELTIHGAKPEGFQGAVNFRSQLKSGGHLHTNGGGWVQNTASVAPTVYVAPYAMVLGNSVMTGNVSLLNTSLVKDAILSNNVQVKNNAFILGGTYSGNAIIRDQAYAENNTVSGNAVINMRARVSNYTLSGTIEVGGDVVVYNSTGSCNNGTYYRMTNYYEDNLLECDGRTASHPDNADVNTTLAAFTPNQMALTCHCSTLPNCLTATATSVNSLTSASMGYRVFPNPTSGMLTVQSDDDTNQEISMVLYNILGIEVLNSKIITRGNFRIDLSSLPNGVYTGRLIDRRGLEKSVQIIIHQ